MTFEIGLPKITLSGTSELKLDKGKAKIERKEAKLKAEPLVNGTLKFNLASLIIQKTSILNGVYAGLKKAANTANKFTDNVRLDISTNKNFRDEFSAADKAERANALVEGSLVIYAEFLIKPAINLGIDIGTSELNETKLGPNMKKMVEIGLEFSAGAAVRGRIHRFYGGLDAGFEISTALSYGLKAFPRKNSSGEEYQEYIDFLYFNGLTATWKVEVYSGTDYDGVEIDHKKGGKERGKNQSESNKNNEDEKYFNPKKMAEERDSFQKDRDDYLDYIEKERQKQKWDKGPRMFQGDGSGARYAGNQKYPGNAKYEQLSKQLNFYNQNKATIEEIQRLNYELSCTIDPNERIKLLEKNIV